MYTTIMFWSEPDNSFLVKVPDLPYVMADGKTRVQAMAAAEVAIQEWIETAQEKGWEVPEPTEYKW